MNLVVHNNGPKITGWELPDDFATGEKFLVSVNAGTFRLILPSALEALVPELKTGTIVHVTRENWQGIDALAIMFDDGTDDPFTLQTSAGACDRIPWSRDSGRVDLQCSVWIDKCGPHCVMDRPATFEDKR